MRKTIKKFAKNVKKKRKLELNFEDFESKQMKCFEKFVHLVSKSTNGKKIEFFGDVYLKNKAKKYEVNLNVYEAQAASHRHCIKR